MHHEIPCMMCYFWTNCIISPGLTGHEPGEVIIFNFEYGKDYSGPGYGVIL